MHELCTSSGLSRSQEITKEVFQEKCFLWEREAPVSADFGLFNFYDL